MSDRIEKLRAHLSETRAALDHALDMIGDRADEQIYSEGAQWTLRQLAIHLMISDRGHLMMAQAYAAGKEFIPADYDIDRYNKGSVARQDELTLEQARAGLAKSRQDLLAWLDSIEDEAILDKTGRYPNLQMFTVSRIIERTGEHEAGHTADMLAMLEK